MRAALWLGLGLFACACGSRTQGEIIELRWRAGQRDAEPNREFVTDTGWQVRLSEARIAVEAVFALAPKDPDVEAIAQLRRLLVPVARAHGGHDAATGRRVRAERLDPIELDLLAEREDELGTLSAEAGPVELVKLEIARASERLPDSLHGHQAYVRGEAERDGELVRFEGGLDLEGGEAARRIEVPAKFDLASGGALTLGVRAEEWLRDAAFERLSPEHADAPAQITSATQVGRAWLISTRNPATYAVHYSTEE